MIDLIQTPLAQIQAGKLKALGVTSLERVALLPNVPTIASQGLPGFQFATWIGLAAPGGTPAPIVNRLHAEVVRVLALPEVKEAFAKQAMEVAPSASPQAYVQFIRGEIERLGELIRTANIPPE
jgi:tripartite-type tricarboxylate transporter receptor subunit TctC